MSYFILLYLIIITLSYYLIIIIIFLRSFHNITPSTHSYQERDFNSRNDYYYQVRCESHLLRKRHKFVMENRWHSYYIFITFYILCSASWGGKWNTYDYQKNEVYPVPKGVGVLHIVHYIRPTFQTNYLQINMIISRGSFKEIMANYSIN